MKKTKLSFAALLSTAVLLLAGFTTPNTNLAETLPVNPVNLTIYWIDTEGGAATLIVTPAGESILIDAGNPGDRDADRIYEVAYNVAGLKQIDHLVITHWHNDHFGGAASLAAKIPVMEIIDRPVADSLSKDKNFAGMMQAYREIRVKRRSVLKPGAAINLKSLPEGFQKLSVMMVGHDKEFAALTKTPTVMDDCETVKDKEVDYSDNANSQVLVMDYGPFRFFDGGDLTWNIEKKLVCPKNIIGTVDVYQVDHHGLDQSNNPLLIKALQPTVSIMGNGTQKGGGAETITSLRNTPSIQAQYQLHKNIRADSSFNTTEEYIANLKADCKGNYIKLTVASDGKKYTVTIPATKHERVFDTKKDH